MRNIFDQYEQQENRLSHALAVCLDEDRTLLREFLRWIKCKPPMSVAQLGIVEQRLPGDPPDLEVETDRKGLPDIVIHDGESWCVFIESKIQAGLTVDQLLRHERTLRWREFEHVRTVVVTKSGVRYRGVISLTWSDLYEWLGRTQRNGRGGEWAERLRSYLRVAEVRLSREGYLAEGTLTMFDGFPFSAKYPYPYGEAKRLLKLAMEELRRSRALAALGMDPRAPGRGAITGRDGKAVWDFLSLKERPKDGLFTAYPHLTLSINTDGASAAVTIPNGVVRDVRVRLNELGVDGLISLHRAIIRRARPLLKRGAWVEAYALQRHFPSQRSAGVMDARVSFKLETSLPNGKGRVKPQIEWVTMFSELLRRKRSNVQCGYVVHLPWETSGLDSRESLSLIVTSWLVLKPLLDVIQADG